MGGESRAAGATRPGLLARAGAPAPSPRPTFKGRRGGESATPRRHHARSALSPASRRWPLAAPQLAETRGARGGRGRSGIGRSGCFPAKQGVNTFLRDACLPQPLLPAIPRPRPRATYTARPEERGGKAQAAHYPRAARGAEERALCPSPVRSPPSHMQMRRINEQREGETELRPGGGVRGGRRACSTHIPTCAGIRVHPVAERAVTSLHKPWLAPGPRGRERAGGRRSPYLPFRESGALDPSTHMTGTRLPPVWGWAVCECLFWMRRRRVQLPSLSTVHRPCS